MQVEDYLRRGRPVAWCPLGSTEQPRLPLELRRRHSLRAHRTGGGRARWACRSSRCSPTASRRISRPIQGRCRCGSRTYLAVCARRARQPRAHRASGASSSGQRPTAATARPQTGGDGVDDGQPGVPRALPQLVVRAADHGEGEGDRPARLPTPPGWRTSPGPASPASPCRPSRSPWPTSSACAACRRTRAREILGDGNFGGLYQRPDADMLAIWEVATAETRAQLEGGLGMTGPVLIGGAGAIRGACSGAYLARAGEDVAPRRHRAASTSTP